METDKKRKKTGEDGSYHKAQIDLGDRARKKRKIDLISRDIHMSVARSVCVSCPKCIGGIMRPTRMLYVILGRSKLGHCKSWTLDWTVDWILDRILDRTLDQALDA